MNNEDVDFLISIQDLEQPDFDNACLERENKRLNKEITRLNNIINELERFLKYEIYCDFNKEMTKGYQDTLDKLKELKDNK